MIHMVSELADVLLDAAVAKAERVVVEPEWIEVTTLSDLARGERRMVQGGPGQAPRYSSEWAHGGPIIERERITIIASHSYNPELGIFWVAKCGAFGHYIDEPIYGRGNKEARNWDGAGNSPLIAAMRAFVSSRFGDGVELP